MSHHPHYKKDRSPPGPNAKKAGRPPAGTIIVKEEPKEARRPTKFEIDQDLIKKLRQAILIGAPILTAAALNDISYEVMRSWVMKGKESPESEYGALIRLLNKAVAEWELRDLSVLESHAHGKPAVYLEEPALDKDGSPLRDENGKILMRIARDGEGRPIMKSAEIKSDWRAAMERMARRKPRYWSQRLNIDMDAVMTFDNKEREVNPKEAMTFEQRIAEAVRELEDEV